MNKLAHMTIFTRVAELESFTQAADSLSMPKARVSLAIRELEEHLDMQLFHRTTRRVSLSSDGKEYYEGCKSILADIDQLESQMKNTTNVKGRIRVDMDIGTASHIVMPQLKKFYQQHPHINIELSCVDYRVDVVRDGFDCVVRVGQLEDSNLIARSVGKLNVVNCASPEYLKKHGEPLHPQDLQQHYLIEYNTRLGSKPFGWEYWDGKKFSNIIMPTRLTVNNVVAYKQACLEGFGIIQVPIVGIKKHLEEGTLIEILKAYQSEPMPISIIYAHRHNISKRVQIFIDWLYDVLKPYTN